MRVSRLMVKASRVNCGFPAYTSPECILYATRIVQKIPSGNERHLPIAWNLFYPQPHHSTRLHNI